MIKINRIFIIENWIWRVLQQMRTILYQRKVTALTMMLKIITIATATTTETTIAAKKILYYQHKTM